MTDADQSRLDPAAVEALYAEFSRDLLAFLVGVLRDSELAREALQATFSRAVESGHTAKDESVRGWLFRVAYNEALALRRMQGQHQRLIRNAAWDFWKESVGPEASVQNSELIEQVRQSLSELPPDQSTVVRMRIYEQKKFADIAQELNLPLGTVLTRMRLALKRLEAKFESWKP